MTPEEIGAVLKERFGEKIRGANFAGALPHVEVDAAAWHDIARFLRDDPRMGFNMLRCITSQDYLEDEQLAATYDLDALAGQTHGREPWKRPHAFTVKVKVPRANPHIPSVADIWPAADWHEREAYDLMGIVFDNHPDSVEGRDGPHPRRILCPDDWEGFPLRKDYNFPMEYHGIPAVTEYGQTRPVH
ncbi:NAD(P)H-quinone oxidoreductase subunit J [Phycisphaerae bacterium RAS2]|nr:NAD(P)H-quinone oxidoreductase subunit J [Phycisphaerae bacterium RAS2]